MLAFIAWNAISALASDVPLAATIIGSPSRGIGLLTVICVSTLLLGAATLTPGQVDRVVTWLLGAGTVVAVLGILQATGLAFTMRSGIVSTLGNTNFAAAAYAMLAILALGRALTASHWLPRAWAGILAAALTFLTWVTDSRQGPAALAAGALALGALVAVSYRGHHRRLVLSAMATCTAVVLALLVASVWGRGPLTWLWAEWTFTARVEYWKAALGVAQAFPVFGSGPDSLGYYSAQFWTDELAAIHGPDVRLDMAHNLPLNYAATLGWVGVALWLTIFAGIAASLVMRIARGPVRQAALSASVGATLVTYLTQGMVSIDVLGLITMGWVAAGLSLALANEPTEGDVVAIDAAPRSVRFAGYALSLLGLAVLVVQLSAPGLSRPTETADDRLRVVTSALAPCDTRRSAVQLSIDEDPPEVAVAIARAAFELDPRCPRMPRVVAEAALSAGDLPLAATATSQAVTFAPLESESWALRGRYLLARGDVAGARNALAEAERLNDLYPTWQMRVNVALLQQELARLDR